MERYQWEVLGFIVDEYIALQIKRRAAAQKLADDSKRPLREQHSQFKSRLAGIVQIRKEITRLMEEQQ